MKLLEPEEVAELLGVSVTTLAAWRHQGTGPAFTKIGGKRVAYAAEDVEAYLQGQKRQGTKEG